MNRLAMSAPKTVWWLDPAKLFVFCLIPVYVGVYFAPDLFGPGAIALDYRVYFNTYYFVLGLGFLSAAFVGSVAGRQVLPRMNTDLGRLPIKTWFLELLALCAILAYFIWFRKLLLQPWRLIQMIADGAITTSRLENRTIGGLTTLTQFGVAYVILFLDRLWMAKGEPLPKRFYWYFWIIVGLATMRVYVWAERLALVEVAVPAVVVYFMHRGIPQRRGVRLIFQLVPLLGVGALLLYFGVTEYFRSWSTTYRYQQDPFLTFMLKRLLTYYYTALNNGAGMLTVFEWPDYRFEYTLRWLYRFPLLVGAIFRFTVGPSLETSGFLARYADPEFNNMSGIFTVFYDVGIGGALLYAVLWGGLCGYLYNSCRVGAGIGRALYPLVYVALLETMRILYLSDQRAFPVVVALLVGYWLARDRPRASQRLQVRLRGRPHRVLPAPAWSARRLLSLWRG